MLILILLIITDGLFKMVSNYTNGSYNSLQRPRRRHGGDDAGSGGAAQLLAAQGQVRRLHRRVAGNSGCGLGDGRVQASRGELPLGADRARQSCAWEEELRLDRRSLAMTAQDLFGASYLPSTIN
jgi:hypothetical protein